MTREETRNTIKKENTEKAIELVTEAIDKLYGASDKMDTIDELEMSDELYELMMKVEEIKAKLETL